MFQMPALQRKVFYTLIAAPLIAGVAAYAGYVSIYYIYSFPVRDAQLFEDSFESGDLSAWSHTGALQLCCPHSVGITTKTVRSGKYAAHILLKRTDGDIRGSKRAELRLGATALRSDNIYEFSVFIPADWEPDKLPATVVQWHGIPDKWLLEAGRTPPLRLAILGDEWIVASHWDADRITRLPFGRLQPDGYAAVWRGPILKGRWTDWKFRVLWSYSNDGVIEIWQNTRHIAQQNGPNTYNDLLAPYMKIGLYVPDWSYNDRNSDVVERSIIIDEIRYRQSK